MQKIALEQPDHLKNGGNFLTKKTMFILMCFLTMHENCTTQSDHTLNPVHLAAQIQWRRFTQESKEKEWCKEMNT